MGYKISYPCGNNIPFKTFGHARLYVFTGLFLLLFGAGTCRFWPEGRQVLLDFLIPGDAKITVPAVENLLQALSTGTPLADALEVFYINILEGVKFAAY